jgi:DNA (cytosine-5)-methyltransferase 1
MENKTNWLPTGPWNLSDLANRPKNGLKVFSCFSCGGGSTMGYKLSGYDVIGCCEIDPEMLKVYKKNHNPKYPFLMGVQDFKNIPNEELPEELFELDVLDGSPPCSSFSMAGAREKKWGKKSHFREGQAEQHLDDLFFDFIDVAKKLQPKVVVAENVKGLIQGNARGYVKQIFKQFREAGYSCQLFLLNSSKMGVPQKRERTFFIANRLNKKISLEFNESLIPLIKIKNDKKNSKRLNNKQLQIWEWCEKNGEKCGGKAHTALFGKRSMFNTVKLLKNEPSSTVTANCGLLHWSEKRTLGFKEILNIQSFPEDYLFNSFNHEYICGMSVPPFMMNRVSYQVAKQLFDVNYEEL